MGDYIVLIISCVFVNNILLAQFLGNCPFLGTSKKMETALGMSMAVIFVMVLAGGITWSVYHMLLVKYNLQYLTTIAFIVILVEMFLKKSMPALYAGLGIFLPLITTNCAVFGACLINIGEEYTFMQSLVTSFGFAAGFGLALILFAGVREKIILARVPKALQDTSIGLITAGIMSLSFFAFKGMV